LVGPIAERLAGYPPSQPCIERHWEDAGRLLLRLIPSHSLDEVIRLRHYLEARAERCARAWSTRIELVAAALVERGTLTRADVVALLDRPEAQESAA